MPAVDWFESTLLGGIDQDESRSEVPHTSKADLSGKPNVWNLADMEVAFGLMNAGKVGLAVKPNNDFSRVWREEFDQTLTFLKLSGFDTGKVDRKREPHIVFFEAFHPLGSVALKSEYRPFTIPLLEPHALVSDNKPYRT